MDKYTHVSNSGRQPGNHQSNFANYTLHIMFVVLLLLSLIVEILL